MSKDEEIRALEEAYVAFRDRIAALPDDAYAEVWLGEWNLAQLLAHMAGWFRQMTIALERVSRGERPAPEGVDWSDVEAWNRRFAAEAKPGRAALDDWDAAFHEYLAAAKAAPTELFGTDPERNRPRIASRLVQSAGTGHFAEHLPELEAWLTARAR
ncbi:MAG: DinB family protein [Dehalococcoidia bacterium]|mgnify:FL=1|nr:DinB family protein [Dehalococcoidia bacterium]